MKKLFLLLGLSLALIIDIHAQWQLVEGPTGGKIQTLAIDTTTNYLYAGTYGAGMFRSKDNGMHWEPVNDGLSNNFIIDIAINGNNIFIGTEGGGIFQSTNNGESWTNINYDLVGTDIKITALASYGDITAIITASNLYFLDNNNLKWKRVSATSGYKSLSIAINNYMIVVGTDDDGVLISTDKGNIWKNKYTSIWQAYKVALNKERIYAWDDNSLLTSSDYAETFFDIGEGIKEYQRDLNYQVYSIIFNGETIIAATNHGVFLSSNNGITWQHNTNFEKQINSIITSNGKIYAGTETDGVYSSVDFGNNWLESSEGLYAINARSINSMVDNIYIGSNGIYKSLNENCSIWFNASNGFLEKNVTSLTAYENNLYASTYGGGVYFTNNNGLDWFPLNLKVDNLLAMSFVVCNNNYLVGTLNNGIYQSTKEETKLIYGDEGYGNPTVWSMIENANKVFAGTSNGLVILNYTGSYWNSIKYGSSEVKSITKNGNTIYAATHGNGIYVSTNGGQNWSTINCSLKINSILTSGDNLIVGTDNGTYTSIDNGLSWNSFGSNLANYKVLSLLEKNGFIYAGTFNGGVWKHRLSEINKNLSVSVKEINLDAEASNNNGFDITSNTNWTISCSENWITTNRTNGSGNSNITLSVNANNSGSRSAYISISRSGVISQIIKINQTGSTSSSIDIETNNLTIGSTENSSNSFEIVSNTNWSAESDQDWLTLDKNEGFNNSKITITAKENPTDNERIAIIRIIGNAIPIKQIKVVQEASVPFIHTNIETLSILPTANSTAKIEIITNTNWNIKADQSWLTIKNPVGFGNSIVTIIAEANNESTERISTISIVNDIGTSKKIVITQKGKESESNSIWQKINGPYGGSILTLEKDKKTGFIYAGAEGGGVLLSKDNGASWVNKIKGLTPLAMTVNSIFINANNIYIGTRDGIYISSDEGENWNAIDNGLASRWINSVVIQNNIIFALTKNIIYKSIDNGLSWENTSKTLGTNIKPLSIAVKNNIVFAGTTNGIYRSFDNGVTWVHNKYSSEITSFEVDGENIYAYINSSIGNNICYSSDNGDNWLTSNYQFSFDYFPAIHANGNNVYVGTYWGIDYSSDNCKNWTKIYTGTCDVNTILETDGKILAGTTKGGILTSANNGAEWAPSNNGISNLTINTIVFHDNNIFVGTYEDGIFMANNDDGNWTQLNNGLLSKNVKAIAFKDNLLFAGTEKGLYLSNDEGASWVGCNNGMNEKDITSILLLGNYIYVGTRVEGVYFSPDNGNTWISNNIGLDNNIYALASNERSILAGSEGYVYQTTSDYWFKLGDLLGNEVYSLVFNGDTAYAASDRGIYYTNNTYNGYWSRIGGYFSNEEARALITKGNNIIIGLNGKGVKITPVNSSNLLEINEGLTNKNVLSLASNDNYIYAGTKGNGLWKRKFSDIIKLSVSKNTLNIGRTLNSKVTFNIYSNIKWSISSSDSWFSLNSIAGNGDALITITANENPSSNPRTAKIKLSGEGVTDQIITLTQEGLTSFLDISTNSLSLNAASNSSTSFDIISNVDWSIENDQNWININTLSGFGNARINVTSTTENATQNPRTATIKITGTGVECKTITITQTGLTPTLTVNPTTLNLAALNSSAIFSITSNTAWSISSDQNWISISTTNGMNNANITVTASENLSSISRTATVTVNGIGVNPKTISVTQNGQVEFIEVTPQNISINGSNNSTCSFEIKSNTSWTITGDQSWITLDKTNGSNNSTINISALENSDPNPRSTTLIIKSPSNIQTQIKITQNPINTTLTINPNSLNLNSTESSSASFEIITNEDWTLFSSQSWLKLNKTAGTGNSSITVTASANTNTSSRNAIVTVRGNNGVVEYVNVTQEPASPTLSVSSNNITVGASNNTFTSFKIYSNSNWTIESNSNWITLDKTNGFGHAQIGITVSQNPLGNIRSGQLTIKCNGLNDLVVNVNQSAAFINVSPLQITLNANQTSSTFNIMSNVSWTIEKSQDWINLDRLQGSGSGTINLQATENTSTTKRTASIKVKCSDDYYKTINITQNGASANLTVYPSNLNFGYNETSLSIYIESNTNWKIQSDRTWLTIFPMEGTGNSNVVITASKNTSNDSRPATITIIGEGINSNRIIYVTQNALPHLIASPQSLTLNSGEGSNGNLLVSSNLNWTASVDQNWLSLSKSSGFGSSSIILTASANTEKSDRIATVTFSATGIDSKTVTVTQNALSTDVTNDKGEIVKIYPNPFNDKINVSVPELGLSRAAIYIYSSYGILVYTQKLTELNTEISLTDLKPGIYVAKITYGDKIYSKVLIKI